MYNKITLVGNLTRDIELHYSKAGAGIAKTAIATTRKYTSNGEKKEEVCFVDITFFGRSAEIANQYLRKGSKCLIDGRLNFEQWTDQNGQKRSKHSVTVETMQMLDTKDSNPDSRAYNNAPPPDQQQNNMQPSYGNQQQNNQTPPPQQQQYQAQQSYQQQPQQGYDVNNNGQYVPQKDSPRQ